MRLPTVLVAALLSLPALAHHNYRLRFDDQIEITLTGVVTKFDWKNPHIVISIDVEDEDGNVANWALPTAAPAVADRNGINPETVLEGDTLVVTGWPARNGTNEMRARVMILEDGTAFRLSPGSSGRQRGMGAGR